MVPTKNPKDLPLGVGLASEQEAALGQGREVEIGALPREPERKLVVEQVELR